MVLQRQSWWLGERLIPLALFSREADDDTLSALAKAMVVEKERPDRSAVEPGKPDFPLMRKEMDLEDYVGPQSWILFDRLNESTLWLSKEPKTWEEDESFLAIRKIVDAMHGVNDSAERGCRTAELYKVTIILTKQYHGIQLVSHVNYISRLINCNIYLNLASFFQSLELRTTRSSCPPGNVPSHWSPAVKERRPQEVDHDRQSKSALSTIVHAFVNPHAFYFLHISFCLVCYNLNVSSFFSFVLFSMFCCFIVNL